MVKKFQPTLLPTEKANELSQHRRNLVDALTEYDKLVECGVECQKDRAEFQDEIARIDSVLENFGPKKPFAVE